MLSVSEDIGPAVTTNSAEPTAERQDIQVNRWGLMDDCVQTAGEPGQIAC